MKKKIYVFPFTMYGKNLEKKERTAAVLVSNLPALVRLESETGVKFTPTGLENDAFGLSYIQRQAVHLFTFAECKKVLLWLKKIGEL